MRDKGAGRAPSRLQEPVWQARQTREGEKEEGCSKQGQRQETSQQKSPMYAAQFWLLSSHKTEDPRARWVALCLWMVNEKMHPAPADSRTKGSPPCFPYKPGYYKCGLQASECRCHHADLLAHPGTGQSLPFHTRPLGTGALSLERS